jgi:hypothetical protein
LKAWFWSLISPKESPILAVKFSDDQHHMMPEFLKESEASSDLTA